MALVLFLSCLYICASSTNSSNQSEPTAQIIESFDIEYPSTNITYTDYNDCSLSLELNLVSINKLYTILSSTPNLQNTILHWLHSHIFLLIDTSFVHDINQYTTDFWNEYYLHLTTISNQTQNTITLSMNICVDQTEIQTIIQTEITTDGDEIAAFLKHKLSDYIDNNYKNIIIDSLSINIITTTIPYITTTDKISSISSTNTQQNGYIFTEKMIYVAIIGICMIIMALIVMVYIILCIKNRTSLKLEQALKDIKSHNTNHKHNANKSINFADAKHSDIMSIDPIHINIPTHLVSIDTGLKASNILENNNGNGNNSVVIERNKLALMHEPSKMNDKELEELKLNIDDLFMQNKNNNIHSLSARNMPKLQENKMDIIYNRKISQSVAISRNDTTKERKSFSHTPHIRKYRNYPQRHSVNINTMTRKQYAKRKVMENKRSVSKPNLHTKSKHKKRKQKLKPSNSVVCHNKNERKRYRNSAVFPLQYNSNFMNNVLSSNKNTGRHSNKSAQSLHNLNINDIPQPNSKSIENIGPILHLNNDWESEPSKSSTNGIIVGTPTTKGAPSQLELEGNSNDNMSNSDAQSDIINDDRQSVSTMDSNYNKNKMNNTNVYKIVQLNKERVTLTQKIPPSSKNIPIPPPPPPPKANVNVHMPSSPIKSKSIIIKMEGHKKEGNNNGQNELKFDALSMIAVHSSHSRCQPSF